jgi:uncharacterized membrane protein YczE
VKDAPLLKGSLAPRVLALFAGLVLVAVGIVAMLESELGLPPWDVFHLGVADHTGLSIGVASVIVSLVVLGIGWAAGAPPGFGTFANAIVIGLTIDRLRAIPAVGAWSTLPIVGRAGLVAGGILLFGLGSALYIGGGFGAGPRDSLMLALSRRTGRRIALVRGSIEAVVLVAGLLLGGVVGVGTVAFVFLIGASIELSCGLLLRLKVARPAPGRAPEFGPLDVA